MRGIMSRIVVHCYEVGLRIYGTNWRCCTLDCDLELCLVTSFLFLVPLYCRGAGFAPPWLRASARLIWAPHVRNVVSVHDLIWSLCMKGDCSSFRIKILYYAINFTVFIRHRPIYRPGRYLGFTDISVSAKTTEFIGLGRCCQNAVIFLTHPDNLCWKAQRTKLRQLSCSTASRCVFINKQTRWTVKHASAVAAEAKASSINQIG